MASRLLSDTILTLRPRVAVPTMRASSRVTMRRLLAILTLLVAFLFLYLAQVSQGTTTAFDIQDMETQYHDWQEQNQELEREIAELESPQHVLEFAQARGMTPRTDAEYLSIPRGQ